MRIGVVGNEACDADSIVSALVYSHVLNKGSGQTHVPFVQCAMDELGDRLDFVEILTITGTEIGRLSFRSILDDVSDIDAWILVDHHFPSKRFLSRVEVACPRILEVVDHHRVVSGEAVTLLATIKKDIRLVGSTCSLIAERLCAATFAHTELVFMLLLVIVLDTGDLSPELNIATQLDIDMHARLCTMLHVSHTHAYWKRLLRAKFNPEYWAKASVEKMFAYDFKDIDRVGYSTVFVPLSRVSDEEVRGYARARGYAVYVVIGCHLSSTCESDDLPNRELIVYSERQSGAIRQALMEKYDTELIDCECENAEVLRFSVRDRGLSRKKFSPVFSQILKNLKKFS